LLKIQETTAWHHLPAWKKGLRAHSPLKCQGLVHLGQGSIFLKVEITAILVNIKMIILLN